VAAWRSKKQIVAQPVVETPRKKVSKRAKKRGKASRNS
jgi:hypothetical protein